MAKSVVAFSGGKDSTCMAVMLAEEGEDFELLFTPTGDESPECIARLVPTRAARKALDQKAS